MFFPLKQDSFKIPASGNPLAKIAIVGSHITAFDRKEMKPFSGPGGTVLESCLHAAGIIRREVYMTNLFKELGLEKEYDPRSGTFSIVGRACVEELRDELEACDANIIVACGEAASVALCGVANVSQYRGYIFPSDIGLSQERKVIPTYEPHETLRGSYILRYPMIADLGKAKRFSGSREFTRPDRNLVYNFSDIQEALEWLESYEHVERVAVDIEVLNYEVSCISFSSNPNLAISIPLVSQWELEEEVLLWRAFQKVLGNDKSKKVLQNGIFDIQFLMAQCGVVTRGPIEDTMIAHSIMYPDLLKGLGFLGSIYCEDQEYWKDTVKFKNIKGNS